MTEQESSLSLSREFRRYARVPLDALVVLLTSRPRLADDGVDLSEGGLCVATEEPLAAGSLARVRVALRGAPEPLDAVVRVAWAEDDLMGLEFMAPAPALVQRVRRAVHRRSAQNQKAQ